MGRGVEEKKIAWMSWNRVCAPKKEGGLRNKRIYIFLTCLYYPNEGGGA